MFVFFGHRQKQQTTVAKAIVVLACPCMPEGISNPPHAVAAAREGNGRDPQGVPDF